MIKHNVDGRCVKDSFTIMTQRVFPHDTNTFGKLYGGKLMDWIDTLGGIVAERHARARVVTASIDSLSFLAPIELGDIVILTGWINYTGRTSMEVEVKVEAENPRTGERKMTCTAFLTFVAVDENNRPIPIPPLILETEEEKRRWMEAKKRREERLRRKKIMNAKI